MSKSQSFSYFLSIKIKYALRMNCNVASSSEFLRISYDRVILTRSLSLTDTLFANSGFKIALSAFNFVTFDCEANELKSENSLSPNFEISCVFPSCP